jgi:cellulose biosynthesis protein BcsQ
MPDGLPRTILVTSHCGGSGKSSTAAALAWMLASLNHPTLLLDLAAAGGCSVFDSPLLSRALLGGDTQRRHAKHPLAIAHRADLLSNPLLFEQVLADATADGIQAIVIDLPESTPEELIALSVLVDLMLVTVPADALALRRLGPMLEIVKECRARPGRTFKTRILPTLSRPDLIHHAEIEAYLKEHLSPLLFDARIPLDEAFGGIIEENKFLDALPTNNPSHRHFQLLALESADLLGLAPVR